MKQEEREGRDEKRGGDRREGEGIGGRGEVALTN